MSGDHCQQDRGTAKISRKRSDESTKRNLALASLGSLLEFYEFMVFGFFTVVIGRLFFPPDLPDAVKTFQAFALYSLGFALRPVSGAIIGHLGDKFGRKKLFMITVLMMALPTLLIGLLPTYAQIGIMAPILLLVLRILQGVALAGEFAGASVFVTEHVPGSRVATAADSCSVLAISASSLAPRRARCCRRFLPRQHSIRGDGAFRFLSGVSLASYRFIYAVNSMRHRCFLKSAR